MIIIKGNFGPISCNLHHFLFTSYVNVLKKQVSMFYINSVLNSLQFWIKQFYIAFQWHISMYDSHRNITTTSTPKTIPIYSWIYSCLQYKISTPAVLRKHEHNLKKYWLKTFSLSFIGIKEKRIILQINSQIERVSVSRCVLKMK